MKTKKLQWDTGPDYTVAPLILACSFNVTLYWTCSSPFFYFTFFAWSFSETFGKCYAKPSKPTHSPWSRCHILLLCKTHASPPLPSPSSSSATCFLFSFSFYPEHLLLFHLHSFLCQIYFLNTHTHKWNFKVKRQIKGKQQLWLWFSVSIFPVWLSNHVYLMDQKLLLIFANLSRKQIYFPKYQTIILRIFLPIQFC